MMTAYFFHGRFVGYNSASLLAAQGSGAPNVIPSTSTAAGLRIGDDVAQARRIHGSAFVVLFSLGGSWRVTTSTGWLRGYLTAVPGFPTPPVPRVADVSAGSVGCPAASPLAAARAELRLAVRDAVWFARVANEISSWRPACGSARPHDAAGPPMARSVYAAT